MVELPSTLASKEPIAIGIFISYFLLIFGFGYLVFRSVTNGTKLEDLFSGRPFLFIRLAVGALGCTWYFMIEYMRWSFKNYSIRHNEATIGKWLIDTALFEEAWSIVCSRPSQWWWSSWICVWSVIFTAVVYRESPKRGIKYPWAYLVFGMIVAISVATSLYVAALFLHPRIPGRLSQSGPISTAMLWTCLAGSMWTIYRIPAVVGTPQFLPTLLGMHVLLLVPFISQPAVLRGERRTTGESHSVELDEKAASANPLLSDRTLYQFLAMGAYLIGITNTVALYPVKAGGTQGIRAMFEPAFVHPAQASISMDVLWVAFSGAVWYLLSGSMSQIVGKFALIALGGAGSVIYIYGVNWQLFFSVMPILGLLSFGLVYLAIARLRSRNGEKRKALLDRLGLKENTVEPGTRDKPPTKVGRKLIVGFWHPYCNAGGGGERVLWSAIAYVQRTQPDTVCLVYSGDYPTASKEVILSRAKDRFSITIKPDLLQFVPLPARYLISDTYWSRFTLLGQSFGSVCLAWQGLTGKDGLWGDIFIDTMGHAFTYPFVRLIAGPEVVIAAYTHYPTVSSDMVRRVRSGELGVESGNIQAGRLKQQAKLVYYHIFTTLYSTSLLFAQSVMTNSSWTQDHMQRLIQSARQGFLASLLLQDESTERKNRERGDKVEERRYAVVYPPCDVKSLTGAGLGARGRGIVSLAQFRPEKDQAKQLRALAKLFERKPEYKTGPDTVTLTLMGGVRDEGDQARLEALNRLAEELQIQDNVEFLVNAPYSDIVQRLGSASIGLNTMQDEHFGINVVEFMAAGLIPIVHASAGPKMDIVVPYKGRQTGYHAKSAEEFAQALATALTLSEAEQRKIREAARNLAKEKFSQEGFEKGWEGVYGGLIRISRARQVE